MSWYAVEFDGVKKAPSLSGSVELVKFSQLNPSYCGKAWAIAWGNFNWDVVTEESTSSPCGRRHIVETDSRDSAQSKIDEWFSSWEDS